MIDSLKIELVDFRVSRDAGVTVQPSPFVVGSGELLGNHALWVDDAGEVVEGNRGFLNTEHFNLTFSMVGQRVRGFLQTSIPKVYSGNNYFSVGRDGSRAVMKKLEGELREAGVHTNIEGARVSRLDAFRNVVADEPFRAYAPVLQLLEGKRQQRREYGTTFLWHNTQQEVCVYDKLEEMRNHEIDTTPFPKNTIRFEHRLLNARKVSDTLGVTTLADLWEGYDAVEQHYLRTMEGQLFRYEPGEVEVLCANQLREELKRFRGVYGRQFRARFLKTYGLKYLLQLADMKTIREAFCEVQGNRMARRRIEKELEGIRLDFSMANRERVSQKTLGSLYRELKRKVLRAA